MAQFGCPSAGMGRAAALAWAWVGEAWFLNFWINYLV